MNRNQGWREIQGEEIQQVEIQGVNQGGEENPGDGLAGRGRKGYGVELTSILSPATALRYSINFDTLTEPLPSVSQPVNKLSITVSSLIFSSWSV